MTYALIERGRRVPLEDAAEARRWLWERLWLVRWRGMHAGHGNRWVEVGGRG